MKNNVDILNHSHQVERLQQCIKTVGTLLIPERDLSLVSRDDLASLLLFLTEELDKSLRPLVVDLRRASNTSPSPHQV